MNAIRNWLRSRGLVRPRSGGLIAGVCAGLGRSLDVSPWVVRLVAVLSVILPGPQVLLYALLWIFMPEE